MPYTQVRTPSRLPTFSADKFCFHSFFALLRSGLNLLQRYDLQGRSQAWKEKSAHIYIDLFDGWICFSDVGQGFWYRPEVDTQRQQSTYTSIDLRLRHRYHLLHTDANELFQQGSQPILNFYVSTLSVPRMNCTDSVIRVNPLYYVTFTTATLVASFVLFRGFNTTDAVNTLSLLSGFLVIFTGVYLLNLSRDDPDGHKLLNGHVSDGVPTDGITGLQTRHSMQTRRSMDPGRASTSSSGFGRGERGTLMHSFEEHNIGLGLEDLAEDTDEEHDMKNANGNGRYSGDYRPRKSEER